VVELIGLLSLINIGLTKWFNKAWLPFLMRLVQLVLLIVFFTKNLQSFLSIGLGIEGFGLLPALLILVISVIEFERIKVRRWVKELLFFTMMVFVTSKLLIVVVISALLLLILLMVPQKVRLVDFISLALILLVFVIYCSELLGTVNTVNDKYYIFLTNFSELAFQNVLVLLFFMQTIKTWGLRRTTLISPILISMILLLKFKYAFTEVEMLKQLLPFFSAGLAIFSFKKYLISKKISSAIHCLFGFSLFVPLLNVLNLRFEVALSSVLLSSIILYSLKLINSQVFPRGLSFRPVLVFINLLNLSAFPLGINGLSLVDIMANDINFLSMFAALVIIAVSWSVFYLAFVNFQETEIFNIWEVDGKIKGLTFFAIIGNIYLIYISLSPLLIGAKNGWSFAKFLNPELLIQSQLQETYSHNLIFVLGIILFALFTYGMKLMNFTSIWRWKFNFINKFNVPFKGWKPVEHNILLENITGSKIVAAIDTIGQSSSYQISLILFVIYLIISLIFLEF